MQIKFENRFMKDNEGICKMTVVDGTDCRIEEPQPVHRQWFSHKFRCACVRYVIGLFTQTGWIVWVNDPYPCGSSPDLKIPRADIFHKLAPGEKILAGGRYRDGGVHAETPNGLNNEDQKPARARHETVSKRIKQFNILTKPYRADLDRHEVVFTAICVIPQLAIETDSPLFQVVYFDNYELL